MTHLEKVVLQGVCSETPQSDVSRAAVGRLAKTLATRRLHTCHSDTVVFQGAPENCLQGILENPHLRSFMLSRSYGAGQIRHPFSLNRVAPFLGGCPGLSHLSLIGLRRLNPHLTEGISGLSCLRELELHIENFHNHVPPGTRPLLEGVQPLFEAFQACRHLTTLKVHAERITRTDLAALTPFLKRNQLGHLTLIFREQVLDAGTDAEQPSPLLTALPDMTRLTYLSLERAGLRAQDGIHVAALLPGLERLSTLSLQGMPLGWEAVQHIVDAAEVHPMCQELICSDCQGAPENPYFSDEQREELHRRAPSLTYFQLC